MKNFALFFQIRVLSTRSDSSSKCTNSGRVPTGEKTRRNQANIPKRRLSRLGYDPFFLRKFRFLCPFGVKKAAIPRQEMSTLGGYTGWPMNCCPAT